MPEKRAVEFGKRRPAMPLPPQPPVKRSGHVALLLMGTLAVGGGAYALMPREGCEPASPGVAAPAMPQTNTACSPRSSSGSSGGSGRSSRSSFYGGSSGQSSSAAVSDSNSGSVTRGGFGSLARAFGFSGHG
jgi:hypothetical protein